MSPIVSGGAQPVTVVTVHVTAAHILNLHNVGIEITATPAAGKMIFPICSAFAYNFVTTPYTLPPDPYLYVSTIQEYTIESNGGFWYKTASGNLLAFPFATVCGNQACADDVSKAGGNGHALAIFTQGAGSAFTLGDGTLDITTAYMLGNA